jgi:hypothetical protein
MAQSNNSLLPEVIKGYSTIPNIYRIKYKLATNIMNDPEFPKILLNDDYVLEIFLSYIANGKGPLESLVPNIIDRIFMVRHTETLVRRSPTPDELLEAKQQLIKVVNKAVLQLLMKGQPHKNKAKNVLSLKKTFGSNYTSRTLPQLPTNTVHIIESFLSNKKPSRPTKENAKSGKSYKVMTNSILKQHKNNYMNSMYGGKNKTKKRRV